MKWDFFDRPENKKFKERLNSPARSITLQLGDIGLAEALYKRIEAGGGKGTARSGVFEVQNNKGIYFQINDKRIDLSTPTKAKKVRFFTWEEFDQYEDKGIDLRDEPDKGPRKGYLSKKDLNQTLKEALGNWLQDQ